MAEGEKVWSARKNLWGEWDDNMDVSENEINE